MQAGRRIIMVDMISGSKGRKLGLSISRQVDMGWWTNLLYTLVWMGS